MEQKRNEKLHSHHSMNYRTQKSAGQWAIAELSTKWPMLFHVENENYSYIELSVVCLNTERSIIMLGRNSFANSHNFGIIHGDPILPWA